MITTINTANAILKNYYLDAVTEQLNTSVNPFFNMIEKSTENVYGKEVRKIITKGTSKGVATMGEDDTLPTGNGANFIELSVPLKNLYASIEISDKVLRASENSEGAVINVLNAEMDSLIKSSKFNLNRMLFGDNTGYFSSVTSAITDQDEIKVENITRFAEGQLLDVYTQANVLREANVEVESIDYANSIVKLAHTSTMVLGDKFTIAGAKGHELTGLNALFATSGNVYGVNVATNPWFTPSVTSMSGPLALTDVQDMIDMIEAKSGETPNIIICSWDVRKTLQSLFTSSHIMTETLVLDGGYKAMSYNGIPIVVDRFCPEGTMYFLNTKYFKLCQLCDWEWLTGEGDGILQKVPGKAAFSATLVKYAELLCENPGAQGRIENI